MKLSLMVVGITSLASDWLTKNWGEVIKLGVFAIIIIMSMKNTLDHNSRQLSTLQEGQLHLTRKVENIQLSVVRNNEKLVGVEKAFERHLSKNTE